MINIIKWLILFLGDYYGGETEVVPRPISKRSYDKTKGPARAGPEETNEERII